MGRQVHVFANIHNLFQTICQTPDRRGGREGASNDTVVVITSLKIIIREGWLDVITRNTAEMISVNSQLMLRFACTIV